MYYLESGKQYAPTSGATPLAAHAPAPDHALAAADDDDEAAASPDPAALLHTFGLLTSSCVEVNVVKICDP